MRLYKLLYYVHLFLNSSNLSKFCVLLFRFFNGWAVGHYGVLDAKDIALPQREKNFYLAPSLILFFQQLSVYLGFSEFSRLILFQALNHHLCVLLVNGLLADEGLLVNTDLISLDTGHTHILTLRRDGLNLGSELVKLVHHLFE